MYELKPNNDALSIYWDKCKHWFDKFDLNVSYAEFAAKYNGLDIYGLYCDNELCGCLFFVPENECHVFHVAVDDNHRGKWWFFWKNTVKAWALNKYKNIRGVAHISDRKVNKLMRKSGFKFLEYNNGFLWWAL